MVVGRCWVQVLIPESRSLKEKRRVVKSLLEQARRQFNVSIAEVGENQVWNQACLGIACVGNEKRFLHSVLAKVLSFLESDPRLCMLESEVEVD